jgi:hypothetical protein
VAGRRYTDGQVAPSATAGQIDCASIRSMFMRSETWHDDFAWAAILFARKISFINQLFIYTFHEVATAEQFELNGITWDHSRGFTPLVAAAQHFHELHPEIEITWSTRSLQAFADVPVQLLSERFDLIVIDHPWSGFAASGGALLSPESHLPADLPAALDADSIGHSIAVMRYGGSQWALAIVVSTAPFRPSSTMLGGTGLAISARTGLPESPLNMAHSLRRRKRGAASILKAESSRVCAPLGPIPM